MKTWGLVILTAVIGLTQPVFGQELEEVARNLLYCSAISDAFSENSRKLREQRDFLLGSAAALTSRQFVDAERSAAIAKVEAKLAETKQGIESGGSSRPQLDGFIEDLKGCMKQVQTYQNEIAAGVNRKRR